MKNTLITTILIASAGSIFGANCASDGTLNSIRGCISGAGAGDIVTLPATTVHWTEALVMTKDIQLQGAGRDKTVVVMDQPTGGTSVIDWNVPGNARARITGIKFQSGNRPVGGRQFFFHGRNDNGSSFRWDHCTIEVKGELHVDSLKGSADNNDFYVQASTSVFHVYGINWNGGTKANKSWSDPLKWNTTNGNTDDWFFIETNNVFNPAGVYRGFTDNYSGSRCVVRHNRIDGLHLATHGTDTGGGPNRGSVAQAVYENDFYGVTGPGSVMTAGPPKETHGSGIYIWHNNRIHTPTGTWGYTTIGPTKYYRGINTSAQAWGAPPDGTNPWDNNDLTGGPGGNGIFWSGSATANSAPQPTGCTPAGDNASVTVSPSLGATDYTGYVIRLVGGAANRFPMSVITSNTSTTINYNHQAGWISCSAGAGSPYTNSFKVLSGESIEIRKVNHGFDEPGYVEGSSLTGTQDTPPWNYPTTQNNQVLRRCYFWANNVWNDNTNAAAAYLPPVVGAYAMLKVGTSAAACPTCEIISTEVPPASVYQDYTYKADGNYATNPDITSPPTTIFATDVANAFQVTVANFGGTPTYSKTGTLPTNVTFSTSGLLSGTATGATPGDYPLVITATYAPLSQTATQNFILTVQSPNDSPVVSITAPTSGATFTTGSIITITASATDADGIAKVEFYANGALIGTRTALPYNINWSGMAANSYALTAKAFDTATPQLNTTSAPVNITVTTGPSAPSPAAITIKP